MAESILRQELATFGISLHQAILDNLVEEIRAAINAQEIRTLNDNYSVFDFIKVILKGRNPRQLWETFRVNDPDTVHFTHSVKLPRKDGKAANIESPTTNISGLIYIAYMGSGDYSQKLRRSSAALIASQNRAVSDPAEVEEAVAQARSDHEAFPISIDELHRTTQIVNKSQIKTAIKRDLIVERDYIEIDEKIFVTMDMYFILSMSFRSLAGTDITRLPEIIQIKTAEYFRIQNQRRMNSRLGKRDKTCEGQILLPLS